MPNIDQMRIHLEKVDFGKFKPLDAKLINNLDSMMSVDMTQLMKMISREDTDSLNMRHLQGGAFVDFISQ